jgi:hypothetical protein
MQKYDDPRDPLAGIINKSIELAEEVQKLWHLDDKQTETLSVNLRLGVMQQANEIRAKAFLGEKEGEKE